LSAAALPPYHEAMHDEVYTPEPLKSGERKFLEDLLNRFHAARQRTDISPDMVDLRSFLPARGALRALALRELIKADLELQWQRGRNILLDSYLDAFPELGGRRALPAPLIYEEYRVRHSHGDKPALESYRSRFPGQFPELERLVQAAAPPGSAHATLKASLSSEGASLTPEDLDTPVLSTSPDVASPQPCQASPAALGQREVLPVGGGYKLIKQIGRGAFGEVWRAEAPGGVEVAVKIIFGSINQQEAAQREFQALELMKRLRNAYLLAIHAYWQLEDRLIIAMELADGSLRDYMKQRANAGKAGIPPDELLRYFREAAEAVDYLHANHVIHRDIKPENILLLGGHVQMADFGLARVLEQGRGLTATRGRCGTPLYMAPEIVGKAEFGEQSDQYSLAATYAELRLNHPLFPSTNLYDLMHDQLQRVPDLAPLERAEQRVLHRALAKDPKQRYASCVQFIQELEKALAPKPVEPPRPSLKRRLLVATLLLFPLVAGIGLLLGYLLPRPSFSMRILPRLVELKAGEVTTVTLEFQRSHWTEPIRLRFPDKPDEILITDLNGQREIDGPLDPSVREGAVSEARERMELRVAAAPDALPNSYQIRVEATTADHRHEATFQLTIGPRAYFLPTAWQRAAEARLLCHDGKVYYDQIDVVRGGTPVRFMLIPKDKARRDTPDTFYMMRDKVWVDLFRRFAETEAPQLKDQRWREMPSNKNARHPAMGVTAGDAHQFARWLGGYLPLTSQWDQAAGLYRKDRGEGPFRKPPDNPNKPHIAVGRSEPEEIGKATDDISLFGIRDMAGNGYEFTRNTNFDKPFPSSDPSTMVKLRGLNFEDKQPLTFRKLQQETRGQPYGYPDDHVGFRVVIEP
jgi:serine/threonine protein kinase